MKKKLLSLMVICLGMAVLTACQTSQAFLKEPAIKEKFVLGTYVKLEIYDREKEAVLSEAFTQIETLEKKFSLTKDSEIRQVNEAAGKKAVKVSEETFFLLKKAVAYGQEVPGFDVTIGALTGLWKIGFEDSQKPADKEIAAILQLVDQEKMILDEAARTVFLKEKGMAIDLGALAKGYIADQTAALLKAKKVKKAILDLGGNIYILTPKDQTMTVGIQDPQEKRGAVIGQLRCSNQSIVTTGIYERYLKKDGQTYHHILDPTTGYPYQNELLGVSIIAANSLDADALSTAVFTLGLESGLEYVEKKAGVEALLVTKDRVYLTQGLKDQFELTNSEYRLGSKEDL